MDCIAYLKKHFNGNQTIANSCVFISTNRRLYENISMNVSHSHIHIFNQVPAGQAI